MSLWLKHETFWNAHFWLPITWFLITLNWLVENEIWILFCYYFFIVLFLESFYLIYKWKVTFVFRFKILLSMMYGIYFAEFFCSLLLRGCYEMLISKFYLGFIFLKCIFFSHLHESLHIFISKCPSWDIFCMGLQGINFSSAFYVLMECYSVSVVWYCTVRRKTFQCFQ